MPSYDPGKVFDELIQDRGQCSYQEHFIDPGIGIAPIENDLVDHIKDPLYDGPQKAGGYQVIDRQHEEGDHEPDHFQKQRDQIHETCDDGIPIKQVEPFGLRCHTGIIEILDIILVHFFFSRIVI